MEKYSAFRDRGTGIQPFLTPIPAHGNDTLAKILGPFLLISAFIRTVLVLVTLSLYIILTLPILLFPALCRQHTNLIVRAFARIFLFIIGFWWISPEYVSRKRGRTHNTKMFWNPKAGDIIVSNWVSWIEVLWLAYRFNPVFVLPITSRTEATASETTTATKRRQSTTHSRQEKSTLLGYRAVTLLDIVRATGFTPPFNDILGSNATAQTLSSIRRGAEGPVVIFPECTTSNGRGLLRFINFEKTERLPITGYSIYVMAVRIESPTPFASTVSLSIPRWGRLNPIAHVFSICSSFSPRNISVRLLDVSESPSSASFVWSDVIQSQTAPENMLTEALSTLVASLGKLKRTGLDYDDKSAFLHLYVNNH